MSAIIKLIANAYFASVPTKVALTVSNASLSTYFLISAPTSVPVSCLPISASSALSWVAYNLEPVALVLVKAVSSCALVLAVPIASASAHANSLK